MVTASRVTPKPAWANDVFPSSRARAFPHVQRCPWMVASDDGHGAAGLLSSPTMIGARPDDASRIAQSGSRTAQYGAEAVGRATSTASLRLAAATVGVATIVAVTTVAPASTPTTALANPAAAFSPGTQQREVALKAIAGVYGVGPIFQLPALVGLDRPQDLLVASVSQLGNPPLARSVTALLDALTRVAPIETGVPAFGPGGTYDSVNGLQYTTDAVAGLLGIGPKTPFYPQLNSLIGPMVNQRRALLLGLDLGGTEAAMAMRRMISGAQNDGSGWGAGTPGVTGVVSLLLRNPSRPGGGLLALLTPHANVFGLNLTNPEAGSYTNPGKSQMLNLAIIDVALAYDLVSDAPTSLNPISWLNGVIGQLLPTFQGPDSGLPAQLAAVNSLVGLGRRDGLLSAAVDATKLVLDPTGGQGAALVPGLGPVLGKVIPGFVASPGKSVYLTYNSGKLPLLEPFEVVPRFLSYLPGFSISTPVTSSFASLLTQVVAVGYQDVQLTTDTGGDPVFVRSFDRAGQQAQLLASPISPLDASRAPRALFDALATGLQQNLLSPEKQRLTVAGLPLGSVVYDNPLTHTVAHALRSAVGQLKAVADPVLDAAGSLFNVLDGFTKTTSSLAGRRSEPAESIAEMVVPPTDGHSAIESKPHAGNVSDRRVTRPKTAAEEHDEAPPASPNAIESRDDTEHTSEDAVGDSALVSEGVGP